MLIAYIILLTQDCYSVIRARIKVVHKFNPFHLCSPASPYDPDGQFSFSALSRLEASGIPVVSQLEKNLVEVAATIGVPYCGPYCHRVIEQWIKSKETSYPPTWRSLYEVLRKTGVEDLSEQIEEYLSCEYCVTV